MFYLDNQTKLESEDSILYAHSENLSTADYIL